MSLNPPATDSERPCWPPRAAAGEGGHSHTNWPNFMLGPIAVLYVLNDQKEWQTGVDLINDLFVDRGEPM